MPLYEYQAEDGEIITLLRTMAASDDPVEDPKGKGRVFKKIVSTTFLDSDKKSEKQFLPINRGCACGRPSSCEMH
tara:strand:+ start:380 stop:604 length:225 start_codon:yes stop_codon:yes gene_type:complete